VISQAEKGKKRGKGCDESVMSCGKWSNRVEKRVSVSKRKNHIKQRGE